jgi:uncharacterized protein YcsI (UPF0317 family)
LSRNDKIDTEETVSVIPEALRIQFSVGVFEKPAAVCCPGYVQANLAAFLGLYAADFEAFCKKTYPAYCLK